MIGMFGANAAATLAVTKIATAQRNIVRVPTPSTSGPETAVAIPEVSRKPVIVHGRSATPPNSAASSGSAAATARPSKATRATAVKMAMDAGSSCRERTPDGSGTREG
jgi:hypothetical protein